MLMRKLEYKIQRPTTSTPSTNDTTELHIYYIMSLSRYFRPKQECTSDKGKNASSEISSTGSDTKRIIVESILSDAIPIQQQQHHSASTTATLCTKQRNEITSPSPTKRSNHILDSDTTTTSSSTHTDPSTEGAFDSAHVVVMSNETFDMPKDPNRTQPPQEPPINSPTATVNRFAKYAFKSQEGGSNEKSLSKETSRTTEALLPLQQSMSMIGQKRPRPTAGTTTTISIDSKHKKEFVPMKDLSERERQSEIEKWHSVTSLFTPPDIDFDITVEDRRYHMVLATILHTRCQEPSVRAAIIQLVNYFERKDVPLTVQSMVDLHRKKDVTSDLVPLIQNLQYHNTKVKYMTQASLYIYDHFNGIVPHTEKELLQLPGIGPLFADLLSTINTNQLHEQHLELNHVPLKSRTANTDGSNKDEIIHSNDKC